MGTPVLEMHSRKSQSARTKAAELFRNGKNVIMFTSDVSARGVDYPDVSLVIQVRRRAQEGRYCSILYMRCQRGRCWVINRFTGKWVFDQFATSFGGVYPP